MHSLIPQLIMLVTALCLDSFAASFVYGAERVRIPAASVAVLSGLSTAVLILSLLLGSGVGHIVPQRLTDLFCFLILFLIGFVKLFDGALKSLIRRFPLPEKRLKFSVSQLHFILTVYADPAAANEEDISVLSPSEAFFLGLSLSLDSAAAGFGAGMTAFSLPLITLLSLGLNTASVLLGSCLGKRLASQSSLDLSWLCGLLLIALAFFKLL